jgi:hypothetical protein
MAAAAAVATSGGPAWLRAEETGRQAIARNMRGDLAEAELRKIHAAGIERIHFAWAGPVDARRPHYYRLHGPTVLIEYDNTQNSANHIHSVWHDPRGDFGLDLLGAHYRTERHHA